MRAHNSTIRIKTDICIRCGKDTFIFSKGRCRDCARIETIQAQDAKEFGEQEDLSGLIQDCDTMFSKLVRLLGADKNGNCTCYTCGVVRPWKQMQCGHYISRKHLFLRWDLRNARPQDNICNTMKDGNFVLFGKRLEQESEGITEILLEESRVVYKPTRDELRGLFQEYSKRVERLLIDLPFENKS